MEQFEKINKYLVYTKVESKNAAKKLSEAAEETKNTGINVVIFFGGQYLLFLAPGYDPYQIRKDITNWKNNSSTPSASSSESTAPKTTLSKTVKTVQSGSKLSAK
jgi:hypothetical protein